MVLATITPVGAQVVSNGDFQSGGLTPWNIYPTPAGQSLFADAVMFDMDEAGPKPASWCARFMAGQAAPNSGQQGINVEQPVTIRYGVLYEIRYQWAARTPQGYPASAATFGILAQGGDPLVVVSTPLLGAGQSAHGEVSSWYMRFGTEPSGSETVPFAAQITRSVDAGAAQWQYIDNFTVHCRADFDNDNRITTADVASFVGAWFASLSSGDPAGDFDGSRTTDTADVAFMVSTWFTATIDGC